MICGGTTTALTLADGRGAGTQVSFYHEDEDGSTWNIVYAMYEETDTYSFAYLLRQADAFYTYADGTLQEVSIENLTAAMFLKYGFEELPPAEILIPIDNMQMYLWKAGETEQLLKAYGGGCLGWQDRPYHYKVGQPICTKHGGLPYHHQKAEGTQCGVLF